MASVLVLVETREGRVKKASLEALSAARGGGSATAGSVITGCGAAPWSASLAWVIGFFLAAMMPLSDGSRAPSPE